MMGNLKGFIKFFNWTRWVADMLLVLPLRKRWRVVNTQTPCSLLQTFVLCSQIVINTTHQTTRLWLWPENSRWMISSRFIYLFQFRIYWQKSCLGLLCILREMTECKCWSPLLRRSLSPALLRFQMNQDLRLLASTSCPKGGKMSKQEVRPARRAATPSLRCQEARLILRKTKRKEHKDSLFSRNRYFTVSFVYVLGSADFVFLSYK